MQLCREHAIGDDGVLQDTATEVKTVAAKLSESCSTVCCLASPFAVSITIVLESTRVWTSEPYVLLWTALYTIRKNLDCGCLCSKEAIGIQAG